MDGDTESRIAGDGMAGSGDANSDCATASAMASHDLRHPLKTTGGAAQAQLGRAEVATRQLADKAYGRTNWTLCPRK